MQTPVLTDSVTKRGAKVVGSDELATGDPRSGWVDPRSTFPRGGYRWGKSDPKLRPVVPPGQ